MLLTTRLTTGPPWQSRYCHHIVVDNRCPLQAESHVAARQNVHSKTPLAASYQGRRNLVGRVGFEPTTN